VAKMKQKSSTSIAAPLVSGGDSVGETAPVTQQRRAKAPPPGSDESLEEVPVVKWKKPILPSDEDSSRSAMDELGARQKANMPGAGGDVPVIKWKKPVVLSDEEESSISDEPLANHRGGAKLPPSDNLPQDVPVVKWKKSLTLSDEESLESFPEDVVGNQRRRNLAPSGEASQEVPVVKWKRPVVPSDEEHLESDPGDSIANQQGRKAPPSQDVPVVKWKRPVVLSDEESAPAESHPNQRGRKAPSSQDVPVVKWKKPMVPSDEESFSEDIVPNKQKLKAPPCESPQDVPVVKWKKPVVPSDEDSVESLSEDSASKRTGRAPDDVPVVKWKKPVMPSSQESPSQVPGGKSSSKGVKGAGDHKARGTARLSPQSAAAAATADVPVVKWKARSPGGSPVRNSSPESLDTTQTSANKAKTKKAGESMLKQRLVKDGLKLPTDSKRKVASPEGSEGRRYKVKMPADSSTELQQDKAVAAGKLGGAGGKAKSRLSPQTHNSNVGKQPSPTSSLSKNKELQFSSARKNKGKASSSTTASPHDNTPPDIPRESRQSKQESSSCVPPELASPAHYPSTDDVTSYKSSSRRSSFSDSRSPSPPSIDPQIRMAINSPVTRRRTPSPARAAASFSRQAPGQNPVFHQKQLQRLNQGLSGPGGMGVSSVGSKLRGPKSGLIKGGSPVKGLTSPASDKRRRQLPAFPNSTANSRSLGGTGQRDSYEGLVTSTRLVGLY